MTLSRCEIQLRRARRLLFASTMYHGANGVSVACQHVIPGAREVVPAPVRLEVHRAQLPKLAAVVDPRFKPTSLLFLTDLEPILDKDNSRLNDDPLPQRTKQ